MAERAPFPTEVDDFDSDERVSFDRLSETYKLEDERGEEWEWLTKPGKWVPVTDEAEVARQQEAYKVAGVDENEPAMDPRKRKAAGDAGEGPSNGHAKKQKSEQPPRNNAIYVTSLPDDVTVDELHDVFSKFGVIAESADSDKPRIKLYQDENGHFKGDALIVYFRPESVQLAIDMLDETDFRLGEKVITGPMRVQQADKSFKQQKQQPLATDQANTRGTNANRDRQKIIKKNQEMASRLAEWDDDDPSTIPDTSSRWDKVVILKHMFTLHELDEDPELLLDIKQDVREECEKIGEVTNVTLYDKEHAGIVTVRFANAVAAEACVRAFQGRFFGRRRVEASITDGRERFKKSKKTDADEDDEEARLEKFSKFIEGDNA